MLSNAIQLNTKNQTAPHRLPGEKAGGLFLFKNQKGGYTMAKTVEQLQAEIEEKNARLILIFD